MHLRRWHHQSLQLRQWPPSQCRSAHRLPQRRLKRAFSDGSRVCSVGQKRRRRLQRQPLLPSLAKLRAMHAAMVAVSEQASAQAAMAAAVAVAAIQPRAVPEVTPDLTCAPSG